MPAPELYESYGAFFKHHVCSTLVVLVIMLALVVGIALLWYQVCRFTTNLCRLALHKLHVVSEKPQTITYHAVASSPATT